MRPSAKLASTRKSNSSTLTRPQRIGAADTATTAGNGNHQLTKYNFTGDETPRFWWSQAKRDALKEAIAERRRRKEEAYRAARDAEAESIRKERLERLGREIRAKATTEQARERARDAEEIRAREAEEASRRAQEAILQSSVGASGSSALVYGIIGGALLGASTASPEPWRQQDSYTPPANDPTPSPSYSSYDSGSSYSPSTSYDSGSSYSSSSSFD
jgi:hypothetical protein